MSLTISNELIKFKTTVEPNLSSMNNAKTLLIDKIGELLAVTTSVKNDMDSVYNSINKSEILGSIDKINEIYIKINSSLETDLSKVLVSSSTLVEKIGQLEKMKIEIDNAQNILNNIGSAKMYSRDINNNITNKNEVDNYNNERQNKINSANQVLSDLNPVFVKLHDESTSLYNELKSCDSTFSLVSESSSSSVSNVESTLQLVQDSSFEKHTFTASNGVSVSFYLYVPKYDTNVEKLPVHLYLHGSGESGGGVLNQSLPKMIKEGMKPQGIVICPQGKASTWTSNSLNDALIELTNEVVKTYSADPKRISLSGHSSGAIGGYKLVNDNPNYFSAFVPISGYAKNLGSDYSNLSGLPIWAFHGTSDRSVEFSLATDVYNNLKEQGYNNMTIEEMEGGHTVQNAVYTNQFKYSDGKVYDPLDWAFSQTKE